jgi:proline dehydrogenase
MKLLDRILVKIGWPFARLFVAGKEMEDALRVAEELNKQDLTAIINFLGEEVKSQPQAYGNMLMYKKLLNQIRTRKLMARISVKPSQIGLKIDPHFYWRNLWEIGRIAFVSDIPLEIDMETEDTVSATIQATIELKKYFSSTLFGDIDLRQAVAMNYKNIFDHIFDLTKAGVKIRLCKGAYKSSISDKNEVKGRYRSAFSFLLRNEADPACATHDLSLADYALSLKNDYPFSCEFQFLLGLRKKTWKKLAGKGEQVAIYVPFGSHWLPYAKRRWLYILKKLPSIIRGN